MHVDIVGTVLLPENKSILQRTKHIDVHHHLICDYVEDRKLKNQFFSSEENVTDPFAKNLSDE